ncbi:6187_t:CDS:1 [Paraglomus occultum]|uniref:Phosphatidylglycerol/phosphatidylinositol transfer protein n=1 Tax=Paraglomus occultum TaxID=144539 RepID=A0A9N9GJY6_9GLOM|nr:6187_t:CDS:1 [Paraglomus occultum]
MTRNLYFLLYLLATITPINAIPHKLDKRTTVFGQCSLTPALPTFQVTVSPDPVVAGKLATYNFSGTAQTDFPNDMEIFIMFNDTESTLDGGDFCNIPGNPACPIKRGTSFNRLFSSVQIPEDLPASHTETVLFIQADSVTSTIACAVATVS